MCLTGFGTFDEYEVVVSFISHVYVRVYLYLPNRSTANLDFSIPLSPRPRPRPPSPPPLPHSTRYSLLGALCDERAYILSIIRHSSNSDHITGPPRISQYRRYGIRILYQTVPPATITRRSRWLCPFLLGMLDRPAVH